MKDRNDFIKLAYIAEGGWGAAWNDGSWNIVETYFQKLAMLSEEHGFKVIIAVMPVSFQVYADFLEDTPQRKLKEKAQKLNFYFIDLLPILRGHRQQKLFFDQCHPKANANDIIGRAISDYLESEVIPASQGNNGG